MFIQFLHYEMVFTCTPISSHIHNKVIPYFATQRGPDRLKCFGEWHVILRCLWSQCGLCRAQPPWSPLWLWFLAKIGSWGQGQFLNQRCVWNSTWKSKGRRMCSNFSKSSKTLLLVGAGWPRALGRGEAGILLGPCQIAAAIEWLQEETCSSTSNMTWAWWNVYRYIYLQIHKFTSKRERPRRNAMPCQPVPTPMMRMICQALEARIEELKARQPFSGVSQREGVTSWN